jgi:hypothetical protein
VKTDERPRSNLDGTEKRKRSRRGKRNISKKKRRQQSESMTRLMQVEKQMNLRQPLCAFTSGASCLNGRQVKQCKAGRSHSHAELLTVCFHCKDEE